MTSLQLRILPDEWSPTILIEPDKTSENDTVSEDRAGDESTSRIIPDKTASGTNVAENTVDAPESPCAVHQPTQRNHSHLGVFTVGQQRMALLRNEIAAVVPLASLRAITDVPAWIVGMVAHQDLENWTPVVDLAMLWEDTSLDGPWSVLIITRAGLALGADNYYATPTAVRLVPFRHSLGRVSVHRAALVGGSPVLVLEPRFVVHDAPQHS